MTTFTWKTNGFSGTFETAANWTPAGGPPGASDDAGLTATGTYTVTTTASDTVNSLRTAAHATLSIGAGLSFTMTNGTESAAFPNGANAGKITLANNSSLFVGGTFNNTSTVAGGGLVLNGAANQDALRLSSATVTFTGGGSVVLGASGNNVVYGNVAADTLVNVNNTFSGVGNIGDGQMTLNNEAAGVINANSTTSALTLQVNGGATNTGLLEATGAGGLDILNTGVTNTGGTVEATGAGADVNLQGATIAGGTLTSVGSTAAIQVQSGQNAYLYGTPAYGALTISSGSNVDVQNNANLHLYGTIDNVGTINLLAGANNSNLIVGSTAAPTTVLTGGGQVIMGGANDQIYGTASADVLDNVDNTISGFGSLGANQMTLVNESAGVINANSATNALTLQANGGVTNTGILEASGAGGLILASDGIDNEGAGNAGQIEATTSGASVDLNGTTVYGGTLSAVSGAQIYVGSGQSGGLYGDDPGLPLTITAGTAVNVANNANLRLYGAIVNHGAITLNAAANNANLLLVTPLTTLSGGGTVVMNGANSQIYGVGGYLDELDNVDNTISGIGDLGANQMTLVNETAGVINANQAGQLEVFVNGGVVNKGLLEATNASGNLLLNATTIDNTQNANAGKISATVSGAHVDLQGGTVIYGGTLTSVTGAYIDVLTGTSAYLDGTYSGAPVKIATGTNLNVANNSNLYLRGVISNNGVINLGVAAGANNSNILLNSPTVTLTSSNPLAAGGVIQLANTANNQIYGVDGSTETLNNINNTIQGSGDIGANQMTLINGKLGVIDANQAPGGSGQPGQLKIYVNGGMTNNGLLEAKVATGASAGGDLLIINTVINQTGGTGKIQAIGTGLHKGGVIDLQGADIQGGTLITTAATSAVIQVDAGSSATLDGSVKTLTDSGVFNVQNNASLYLNGAISTTKGSINLLGAANATYMRILNTTTLSGAGKVTLSNSANNEIIANSAVQDLFNVDNTISGAGNIGAGTKLILTNETAGVVDANQTTALTLQDASTIENYGLIESTAAGGLDIYNTAVDNTISNGTTLNTGQVTATGTGHVDLQGGSIYGGTLTTTGSAVIDVVTGSSGGLNGTVLGQAVNIAAGSNIVVNNNSSLYLYGTINNAGTITEAGAANTTYIRLGSSVVTLSGGGALVLSGGTGNDDIIPVAANARLDNINNTISGAGNIGAGNALYVTNESAGVIDATLAGGITINLGGVQMINAGTLEATGSNLSVTNSVFNTGTIVANGGNVTIGGNVNGTGGEQLYGTSNLEIASSVGGAAAQTVTFESGSSGTFKIDQAQNFNGTVAGLATNGSVVSAIDLANLSYSTASLTYAGTTSSGVLTVTDGTIVSTIKLTGDYVQSNFGLAADTGGHTLVTYNGTGMAAIPAGGSGSVDRMVAAMAAMGGGASASSRVSNTTQTPSLMLATPHAA